MENQTNLLTSAVSATEQNLSNLQNQIEFLLSSFGTGDNANNNESSASSTLVENSDPNDASTLDLTPPDQLLASDSANLANLNISDNISKLTVNDVFKSLGETILGKTIVAGDLIADGTFSISNGNEINVIGLPSDNLLVGTPVNQGILYLQKSPLTQGLDIFDGKVKLEKDV